MTSTPSPHDEHPEIDEISALGEGIVPAARRAELRAHLITCALCAEVSASLEEIRETLGTLPGPERMPQDVASRIDRALAAEAAAVVTGSPGAPESPTTDTDAADAAGGETDTGRAATHVIASDGAGISAHADDSDSGDGAAHERSVSRETPAESLGSASGADGRPVSRETRHGRRSGSAAAGRPPGHAAGSTGPGGADRGATPGPGRDGVRGARRRRRTIVLVAAASMAVLTMGGITLRALSDSAPTEVTSNTAKSTTGKQAPQAPSSPTVSADTDAGGSSDDQQLRKRVQGLLSDKSSPPPSREVPDSPAPPRDTPTVDIEQSPSSDGNTLRDDTLGDGPTVPSCIRDSLHRTESPLAVDSEATFQNHSGYLLVLPHQGGDPKLVDAYVVDPSCVNADPSRPGKVLFKGTYPRG
ncbi:anti-sigma factor family protein [Streptomyces sp. NPDC006925]|uniref:anti-sigma factor family protein n=1 Tax=Streptomyces sp. NPDC006925 TaxID=3364768 RepID=UPI003680977F